MGAAVVGVGALAACGAPEGGAAPTKLTDAPVTIKLFKRSTIADPDVYVMMADWYKAHPTWKAELVQDVGDLTKLAPYIASGEKIDLLGWNQTARTMKQLTGTPRPIDDVVKRDKYPVQQFSAKEVDLIGRYDGKLYALPYAYGGNATALYYNRSLFKAAGLPEPPEDWNKAWTWDQFKDVLRKLTKKTGASTTQIGLTTIGDPITSLPVFTDDAKWISDDYSKAVNDSPAMIDLYQRWADVVLKDGATIDSPNLDLGTTSGETAFLTGKAAMHIICCGPAGLLKKLEPTGIDWAFAPTPKIKFASPDFQSNIVMPLNLGQYPDHAWELMKYLIAENRWGNAEARIPAVLEDAPKWTKETFKNYPNVRSQVIAESVRAARPVDKIKYHTANKEMYDSVVKPALAEIWKGQSPVAQGLKKIQPLLQGLIDKTPK
jgi:multiple sugar transport system substrate-binding protein